MPRWVSCLICRGRNKYAGTKQRRNKKRPEIPGAAATQPLFSKRIMARVTARGSSWLAA